MLISFTLRRFAEQLAVAMKCRRSGRLRSRRHAPASPVAAHVHLLESRELLSNIVVSSLSGGQNYAATVTFNQLDPAQTAVTLRDAINAANNTTGADSISFDAALFPAGAATPATIVLTGGTPLQFTDTTGATTIDGPGASAVAVSGNNLSTVFLISAGVTVAIDELTITGGKGSIDIGGGLKAGGGLYNNGHLTLQNTILTANAAGNYGGGFYNAATGTVAVIDSTIAGNSGQLGGGFLNGGIVTVSGSSITGNQVTSNGGGIYNLATLTVTASLVANNTATFNGGGIFSNNTATVVNSTLTGNAAGSLGGAFFNSKTANFYDSTIAGNFAPQGAGIEHLLGTTTLFGTIVARNSVSATNATPRDWAGLAAASASSYNLIGDGASTGLTGGTNHNLVGTAANPLNPLLAPLGDYGGPTQTMALLPGSAALAAGANFTNPATGTVLSTDQRGILRSLGSAPDIGAYQSAGFAFALLSGDNQSAIVGQSFADPLAVQLVEKGFGRALPGSGISVNFAAPPTSASATLSAGSFLTNGSGIASILAQANGTIGGPYLVVASAAGVDQAQFSLTNLKVPSLPPSPPTVSSLTTTSQTPLLAGTWDSTNAILLQVTISNSATSLSTTYTLGIDAQLTASNGSWSLDLGGTSPLAVGTYELLVHTANDIGESADSSVGTLVIQSIPPVIGALAPQSANIGAPVVIATAIIGGDTTGLTAIIDWGDGTTSAGTIADINGVLTISGSHAYAAIGTFDIELTVTNAYSLSATAATTADIASIATGADLLVTGERNVQIIATSVSASYEFDIAFVSGGVQLTGTKGTTFNGAGTLFLADARSIFAQLGDGNDHVRITGKGQNVTLALGAGQNAVIVKKFDGDKLRVSSGGALCMHVWNSTLSHLFVTGGAADGDHFRASGLRVTNETQLALGGGLNRVKINNSRFRNFQLISTGNGTVVRIETGRADGAGTQFDGPTHFQLGAGARLIFSPLAKSDQTVFWGNLVITAGTPDAAWRYANVRFAKRPTLVNVDVV